VLNHSAIVSHIGPVPEHDFDAVAIQIEHGSVEMTIVITTRGWRTIWTTSSRQGCCIEVANCCPARGGECNVCSAGFYAIVIVSCGVHKARSVTLPRRLLAKEEVRVSNAEAYLIPRLSYVSIT
jgi:hypothetical protein